MNKGIRCHAGLLGYDLLGEILHSAVLFREVPDMKLGVNIIYL
jgi:hypothetical protein